MYTQTIGILIKNILVITVIKFACVIKSELLLPMFSNNSYIFKNTDYKDKLNLKLRL